VNDAETLCTCRKECRVKYDPTTAPTLQNFNHKNTLDLENVQGNKKKEKGEFTGRQN